MAGAARDAEGRVGMDGEPQEVYVDDDEASVLLSLKRLLSGFGFEVFSYLTAEGFLQDHETERNVCVILDLIMPGMAGLRLLEKLALCGRPLIFLSGSRRLGREGVQEGWC